MEFEEVPIMESFEEVLAHEAALLHESGEETQLEPLQINDSDSPTQAGNVSDVIELASDNVEDHTITSKSGRKHLPPGCSTFPTTTRQDSKRKRAAFEDPACRAKVAHVRKNIACMRCHIKKIPCSTSRPCVSCISCRESRDARSSRLKWMECVPYSWKDVNIYQLEPLQNNLAGLSSLRSIVLIKPLRPLLFGYRKFMNIEAFSKSFAEWLTMDDANPRTMNGVGVLSSFLGPDIMRNLGEHICTNLTVLLKTSLLLRIYKRLDDPHGYDQLTTLRQIAGAEFLKSLEIALKDDNLSQASREKLLSLSIILTGAIFAVKYIGKLGAAGRMLLRILTHYLVFILERVGCHVDNYIERAFMVGSSVWWKDEVFLLWCTYMIN